MRPSKKTKSVHLGVDASRWCDAKNSQRKRGATKRAGEGRRGRTKRGRRAQLSGIRILGPGPKEGGGTTRSGVRVFRKKSGLSILMDQLAPVIQRGDAKEGGNRHRKWLSVKWNRSLQHRQDTG